MQKRKHPFYRFAALLLAGILLGGMLAFPNESVLASKTKKVKKTYDIAVIFDNSGSMYGVDNAAWCRAKYAIEIFASMLNYSNGDVLKIYPMWEVVTDGSTPTTGGSYSPVEIKSGKDIDKISNMYTVAPSETPFAPISEAHAALSQSKATERWLIVLTDGEFNQEARGQKARIDLQSRLASMAQNGIKVQYLGLGKAIELTPNEAAGFYTKKSTDTSLKDDLIQICNQIFQRDILPANRMSGDELKLDLSMKTLIVFAQGSDAKVKSLKTAKGKEIKQLLDSGQRKFSRLAAGKKYVNSKVDESLVGQVVTFSACPKGTYKLQCTDADKIQIFYEPDVDIAVTLTDSDGVDVDPSDGVLVAGDYKVTSRLIDSNTGKDVTKHELMGDVTLNTYVQPGGGGSYQEYENGATITFTPEKLNNMYVEGTYLRDYTISTKEDPGYDWMKGFIIAEQKTDFAIHAVVEQPNAWHVIKKNKEWKPIRVNMTIEGNPLTDEQVERVAQKAEGNPELAVRCETIPGESAFNVYLCQDSNGKFVEPQKTGKYRIDISGTYTDEYGTPTTSRDSVEVEIQKYSRLWGILRTILIILAIIIFILWAMFHKTYPKRMKLHAKNTKSRGFKEVGDKQTLRKSFRLSGDGNTILTATAKKATPFIKRKSGSAKVKLADIKVDGNISDLVIDGQKINASNTEAVITNESRIKFKQGANKIEKEFMARFNAKK